MVFDLHSLNPQQREAVVSTTGPVLILAGAGTGKTRTLTCRIVHMIQTGISPSEILAVTFTNKAAREMSSRVQEMMPRSRKRSGEKPERPTLCTFHSLCVRVLRQHIDKLGYKRNFVIYDQGDQLAAVRKILNRVSVHGEKVDPNAVLSMMSRIKNAGSKELQGQDPSVQAVAEVLMKHYSSALRGANAVDFDDLILLTLRLFEEHPDALEACRARWPYVMVDEYQDTNATQFALIHHLTRVSRNLCVVGDDDQSIYGWRGAEIANILDLEQHYPEVKIIKLEQNYRSTNMILKAANAVIQANVRRRPKSLWSAKPGGDKVLLCSYATDEAEAQSVVENIEYDRIAKKVPWNHHAILFRTNLQSRPLETALRKARVRYHLIGGQSFFDRREIRDFLAYLKVIVNPDDDISLLRIANTPTRGISDVTRERLLAASAERDASVYAVMRHTDVLESFQPRTQTALQNFIELIERLRAPILANHPLSLRTWAESWLTEIGYIEDLRRSEKDPEVADNRVKNLRDLVLDLDGKGTPDESETPLAELWHPTSSESTSPKSDAGDPPAPTIPPVASPETQPIKQARVSLHPRQRLDAFLADLTLDREWDTEDEPQGDAVILITVHAAKGLEFPHVHLVGVEKGLMPHSRSEMEGTLDEERRLFYVALTRAQETLRVSHCAGRRRYGQVMPCHPSPFLTELPEECVEHADASSSKPVEADAGEDFFAAMRAALD
jgi:superfamily I DNA/RNA helicase